MHGMRPFGALLPKEEALALILDAAAPLARAEHVPLAEARGRVSAEDVRAPHDVPPYARATMDGYAVRAADGSAPRRVTGELFAGARVLPAVDPGGAVRIATGAPVPPGADAVVRVEDADERDGTLTTRVQTRAGAHVDPAGADLLAGALAVAKGARLTPARLGVLASVGRADVRVAARPRVAVVVTGDELLDVGAPHDPHRIHDSNGTTLRALLEDAGALVTTVRARDEIDALRSTLRASASACDLVVVTGGASVGARDLVVDALDETLVHGVRVKPGKPLLVGRVGGILVVGLPGNPTSALSNAALFVVPALRQMAGLPPEAPRVRQAVLSTRVAGERERYLFLPVRLEGECAHPTFKGSGALTSLSESDGWIGVPEGATLAAGARVRVTLW